MRRSLIILAVLLLIGSLCRADGTMINSYRYVAAGGGGTLLVGDNSVQSLHTGDKANAGYAIYGEYVAVSSGSLAKGYARLRASTDAGNAKMVVWNSSYEVVAISSATAITTSEALYEFTFSSGSITASATYYVGWVSDVYTYVAVDSTSYGLGYESNSYASPTVITGSTVELGQPEAYVTN